MERSLVRRSGVWIATAISLAVFGCGGDDPADPGGGGGGGGGGGATPVATTAVSVTDNQFVPAAIVVAPSATVTWTFTGSTPHNVIFPSTAIADSGNLTTGTFATAMPAAAGTYSYSCTIHAGMNGTVQVQ
jgi:plastocyanin